MSVPEQRQDQTADVSAARASDQDTTPRIMVGAVNGEVAVVEARTGRVCWMRRIGRIYDAFALDEEAAYLAPGGTFALQQRLRRASPDSAEWRRVAALLDTPTQLEARRARDGALLWTYADPLITGRMSLEVESGIVVAADPQHYKDGAPDIQAFDATSGSRLWALGKHTNRGEDARFVTAHSGRAYARLRDSLEQITALDIRTGKQIWQRRYEDPRVFSPSGALIGEPHANYDEAENRTHFALTLIDAHDGSELASFPTAGVAHQISDDGIAYVDRNYYEEATWIAAVDIRTGEELWRTTDVDHDYLALDGGMLYYSRLHMRERIVEIGALNAATGERLWQWRTPANLTELLHLWGPRHMPLMLWDSTKRITGVLGAILAQKHHIAQAVRGRSVRGKKPSPRRQAFRHEFYHGQWRHPWQLHNANNANWLAARWGIVFLGTWLGLFALDARDGRLLWHALPTLDLSFVAPALAP
jgi:outer membrane protein assembly factor BamB